MKKVLIRCQSSNAPLPCYETAQSSGADLRSTAEISIAPGEWKRIPTGLRLEIPLGLEGQVRPRSGLAARSGVTVLNAPGTIDADYRGEIEVILINHGKEVFSVKSGDRIAQLVFAPIVQAQFLPSDNLNPTERGAGGFGSTG